MNDLPLTQPGVVLIALSVIAVVFLIGLAVGDWHGYRRRKRFDDDIESLFNLDLTLDDKFRSTQVPSNAADNEYMSTIYKAMSATGKVVK